MNNSEFVCSCIYRICEVSFSIVAWPSLNFCAENSSTRNSWALFFFSSHGCFLSEFCVELFPLLLILLVVLLALVETQYIREGRPPIPIFEHTLDLEVFRIYCWEIPLDVLVSRVRSDFVWSSKWSLFPSRCDFPTIAFSSNLKNIATQKHCIKFP